MHRCAYCGHHEGEPYAGGHKKYDIDHFRPKSDPKFQHLKNTYSNLYYCCKHCNISKSDEWPSPEEEAQGYQFLDPCMVDFEDHFRVDQVSFMLDISISSLQNAAAYTVEVVGLNDECCIKIREKRAEAISASEDMERILDRLNRLANSVDDPEIAMQLYELLPQVREANARKDELQVWLNPQPS